MGGITSALQFVPLVKEGIGVVSNVLSSESSYRAQQDAQNAALAHLQQQQALQMKNAQAEAALERESIALKSKADEDARLAALRRAVARQRANYGASGTGSAGGSAQAVLLGLFDETEDELASRGRLDSLRSRALDMSLENRGALNILQRTQLQERAKISGYAAQVGRYSNTLPSSLDALSYADKISSFF